MTFLVVANFKSNLTKAQAESWLEAVKPHPSMVIAPSFPHLDLFTGELENWKTGKHLSAQDVSPFPPGAYTGAVSARELKDLGVTYCIVGHSERRRYFHETHVNIAAKVSQLLSVGIIPILCLEESDIIPQFAALDDSHLTQILYCFEPAVDIGGTTTASPELINSVREKIHNFVPQAPFLYGGSVTADNIASLLSLNLAGVLVASDSLDPSHYLSIVSKASHGED